VTCTLRFLPLPYVTDDAKFLVRKSRIPGVYQVVVRIGYMEDVDLGPAFVHQLVGCLVRHVTRDQSEANEEESEASGGASGFSASAGGGGISRRGGGVAIDMPAAAVAAATVVGGGLGGGGDGATAAEEWTSVQLSVVDEDALEDMSTEGARVFWGCYTLHSVLQCAELRSSGSSMSNCSPPAPQPHPRISHIRILNPKQTTTLPKPQSSKPPSCVRRASCASQA